MPITNLELVGYKTFATTTNFDFAEQITAIVGPNGSGKSNIADAIRWVLGEQSYSLLRGRKTVDMIFSGSDSRSRAGMASATLVFDNTNGWLPIDFSEVAVTRRAYRDGQNEYLINGQKVRLRDVSELLSRAGLAERTYTIIGQGLVDAALSLKAGERRKLFEEAAGIGIYRARREEAIKKLDATRRNLERVQDILSELTPRLKSLAKQARRAGEYEQLQKDLHVLLREWYGYHWHDRQNTLKEAQHSVREREEELRLARQRMGRLDIEVEGFRKQIHDLREKLNGWLAERGQLHQRRERISRELAVAQERTLGLEEKNALAKTDKARQMEARRLLYERLERSQEDLARLEEEHTEATRQLEAVHATLSERTASNQEIRDRYDTLRRRLTDHQNRISQNEVRIEELKQVSDNSRVERFALEEQLADRKEKVDAAKENLWNQASRQREFSETASEIREQRDKIKAQADEAVKRLGEIGEAVGKQEAEIGRLQAQVEVLQQAEKALAGFSQGAQKISESLSGSGHPFAGKVLGSLIEVESGYEQAVAAGLGPYIDSNILHPDDRLLPALDLLDKNGLPGGLLPLASINQPGKADRIEHGDILARPVDVVRTHDDLLPLLRALLGNAIIVRDRETALRLRRGDLSGFNGRIITLKGEVFEPDGAVLSVGESGAGLIARPKRLRQLSEQLIADTTKLEALQRERLVLAEKAGLYRSELEALDLSLEAQQQLIREAETAHLTLQGELDQLQARADWLRSRHVDLTEEVDSTEIKIAVARQEIAESTAEVEQLGSQIAGLRQQLDEKPLEDLQTQAAFWTTQAAVAERAAADARMRRDERRQAVEQADQRLTELDLLLEAGETGGQELLDEIERLKGEEMEIGSQLEGLAVLIEPAERELETLETRQDNIRGNELETRQALSVAERNHAQAQITLARRQEALDSLRHRIEDDFGIVAFEYLDDVPGQAPLPVDDLVEALPIVRELSAGLEQSINRQRAQLRRMGAINPEAREEFKEVEARHTFMVGQVEDLGRAEQDVMEVINELDLIMEREFRKTFDEVAREFRTTFTRLFGGGSARILLTDPEDLTESGVDIEARLPGRRAQGLSLLSGGERSLTAIALVFSLIKVSPTPFCVLDEVDAMLDEANVNRFADLLRELSKNTQFIIITHNRNTVQSAETIYGVTMGRDSTSQVLGLKLDEVATVVGEER